MPTKSPRSFLHQAMLCAAAFVAILPMLFRGPSCGHDFDFHILSWLEAANQFSHFGYPHWAFTPAWNAGEPRFIFYPPLSWTLGAILGLILPWNFVPAAFTWTALALSGLTMYRLAGRYASSGAALVAATLYLANPYMLFTAYERTAYGELLAAAWLPLLFAAALAPRIRILAIAIPLALIWLTNAPAAVMSSYALAFITLIRLCTPALPSSLFPLPSKIRLALTTAAGTALALALAAFYIIPATYEQRFVQIKMAVIPGMSPADHFLFHRMSGVSPDNAYHEQVVHTASLVALTILATIAVAFLFFLRSTPNVPHSSRFCDEWDTKMPDPRLSLILLTLLLAFLLTPPSLFLWNHVPELAFLQFPWRLTALLSVILASFTALALNRLKPSTPYSLLPIPLAFALVVPCWHLFHQPCDPEDTVPARVALFHSNHGTEPTDEYTPIGADGDALKPGDPPYWLLPANADINAIPPSNATPGTAPIHLTLTLPAPEYLVLNLRQYPQWQVHLNGNLIAPIARERDDGLITLQLPAGTDTLDLNPTRTPDQTIGLAISALAAITTLLTRKKLTAHS